MKTRFLTLAACLLVAGQALAAPAHLPHPGRTAVEQRTGHQSKAPASHGHHGHGHHAQHQRQKM